MSFMKRNKWKIIAIGVVVIALAISLFLPTHEDIKTEYQPASDFAEDVKLYVSGDVTETDENAVEEVPDARKNEKPAETEEPEKEEPKTEEPAKVQEDQQKSSCTLTVRCDTILSNLDKIAPEKVPLVPENGVILSHTKTEFAQGETVFDILLRELKKNKIHLEFQGTTVYDSVYIEGIGNLYEFDCGNLSGWIYRVNGKVPSVGCSSYEIKDGDQIEFLYTCNMGRDL